MTPERRRLLSVIALALLACAFFAGINVLARFLTTLNPTPLHPFQISFGRYLFAVMLLTPAGDANQG